VDSIKLRTLLPGQDSVKYISFSDGRTMELSRTLGFVKTFNFLPFVHFTNQVAPIILEVVGYQGNQLGVNPPDYTAQLGRQVGDRKGLFTVKHVSVFGGSHYETQLREEITAILPDSNISLQLLKERIELVDDSQNPPATTTHYPAVLDTLSYSRYAYRFLDLQPYEHDTTAIEPFAQSLGMSIWIEDSLRVRADYAYRYVVDTCLEVYALSSIDFGLTRMSFATGLGLVYEEYSGGDVDIITNVVCFETFLSNYGSCAALVGTTEASAAERLVVSPQPSTGRLELSMKPIPTPGMLSLVSMQGQVLLREPVAAHQTSATLDLSSLPAGMYLLRVASPDLAPVTMRVIKQ
jgi:hypothetical protein